MEKGPIQLAAISKPLNPHGQSIGELTPSLTAAADDIYADGLTFFYDGAFKSALDQFQKMEVNHQDTRVAYFTALCQYRLGAIKTAKQTFLDLLEKDPDHHRARMALFELYAGTGDIAAATRQSQYLDSAFIEDDHEILLDRLKMMRHVKPAKTRYNIVIAQGIRWNSNINAGSDQSEIIAPDGRIYRIDDKDRELDDWGTTTHLYGWYRHDPQAYRNLFWDTAASLYHVHYFEHNEYNYTNIRLKSGPVLRKDAFSFRLPAGYQATLDDGRLDSHEFFIKPAVKYTLNKRWAMSGTFFFGDRTYDDGADAGSDKSIYRFRVQPILKLSDTLISATAGLLDADAKDNQLSYRGVEAGLYARHRLTKQMSISFRYKHRVKKYQGVVPGWFDRRQDVKNSLHASVIRKIGEHSSLGASISWLKNNSNTALFEYEKYTAGVNLALKF